MATSTERIDYGFETVTDLCRFSLRGAKDFSAAFQEAKSILYQDVKLYNRLVDQLLDSGLAHAMRQLHGNEKRAALRIFPAVDDRGQQLHDTHGCIAPIPTLPKGVSGETLARSHDDDALRYMSEPILNSWFGSKMLRNLCPTELEVLAASSKKRAASLQLHARFLAKVLEAYRAKEPESREKRVGEVLTEADCQKAKKEAGLV
jgi:hypothetical protein